VAALLCWGIGEEPVLRASTGTSRVDMDGDGLTDNQEMVIGTMPDRVDSDGDGYSDLEEVARRSDPLDVQAVPGDDPMNLGMTASLDGTMVRVLTAVYIEGGDISNFRLRIGMVFNGQGYSISPAGLRTAQGYTFAASGAADLLAAVEFTFPEHLVARFGQMNLYSLGFTLDGSLDSVVGTLPLVDMGGVTALIEPMSYTDFMGFSADGVAYRPLGGSSNTPLNWTAGEICFQRTATVGTDGVMLIQEVESADCVPTDSYCSGSECSGSVGTTLMVPNPTALAGG
jgi:hypothetical protein